MVFLLLFSNRKFTALISFACGLEFLQETWLQYFLSAALRFHLVIKIEKN